MVQYSEEYCRVSLSFSKIKRSSKIVILKFKAMNNFTKSLSSLSSTSCSSDDDSDKDNKPDFSEMMASTSYVRTLLKENRRVTLAYCNFKMMPATIPRLLGDKVQHLDLGHNDFRDLSFLSKFTKLYTLVLDWNRRMDVSTFPAVPTLKFLWINNCKIENMQKWIERLSKKCPQIEHISTMCNPFGSPQMNGGSMADEDTYRERVCSYLKNLKTLDGRPIERKRDDDEAVEIQDSEESKEDLGYHEPYNSLGFFEQMRESLSVMFRRMRRSRASGY